MTTTNAVTSSVEVAADPETAFAVFTEELDCWWIQGPINFFDARVRTRRAWSPASAAASSRCTTATRAKDSKSRASPCGNPAHVSPGRAHVDDVQIDVSFSASNGGTLVRVEATIPEGGADRGGTAWVRTTPKWFGRWIDRRDREPHEPLHMSRLAVAVHYTKPATAAQWLRDVFGFEPAGDIPENEPDDINYLWIEFHVGNASLMVFGRTGPDLGEDAPVTHTPWVFVDDLDEQYARRQGRRGEDHRRNLAARGAGVLRGRPRRQPLDVRAGEPAHAQVTRAVGRRTVATGCSRRRSTDVRTGDQRPDE